MDYNQIIKDEIFDHGKECSYKHQNSDLVIKLAQKCKELEEYADRCTLELANAMAENGKLRKQLVDRSIDNE